VRAHFSETQCISYNCKSRLKPKLSLRSFTPLPNLSRAAQYRQHCVNGDSCSQWEMAIFDSLQNQNPLTDCKKLSQLITSARRLAVPILMQILQQGLLGKWVKYIVIFLHTSIQIYTFFMGPACRSDP